MGVAYKIQEEYVEYDHYTYKDYIKWDAGIRCELIDGAPYMMAGPSIKHQRVCGLLYRRLVNFLFDKPCEAFIAPVDVRLNINKKDDTVVQPDVFVVCDKSKLENGKSCIGAPDLVIEVLSPSNKQWDYIVKQKIYLKAGVREYWIVDPEKGTLRQLVLKGGKYLAQAYGSGGTVPVNILEGCEIDLDFLEAVT